MSEPFISIPAEVPTSRKDTNTPTEQQKALIEETTTLQAKIEAYRTHLRTKKRYTTRAIKRAIHQRVQYSNK